MKICLAKILSFVFVLGVYWTNSSAQNTVSDLVTKLSPKPLPRSPEVTALGRFGDHTVNLYTGLPDISIQLCEVKSGALSLPVTLSYHASGIRYTQQATWVGLGWSLSAGGSISRDVRGKRDEDGFLISPLKDQLNACTNYWYLRNAVEGSSDLEADQYSYSFPGKSGKFFRRSPSTGVVEYVVTPYDPLQIIATSGQFEIKNTDGRLYRFGKNSSGVVAVESTTSGSLSATTAWHLMQIKSPNKNDSINFDYQSIGLALVDDISWSQIVNDQCQAIGSGTCPFPNVNTPKYTYSNSSTSQTVLSTIRYEGGKVDFVASASNVRLDQQNSRFLDQIIVYSETKGSFVPVKYIKFNYSYFKNQNNTINLRLKLDGLDIKDANQNIIQKYRFTYFTNNFSWDVPRYSNRRDFWDYYNGAPSNTNLIPAQSIVFQDVVTNSPTTVVIGGANNRDTNPAYLKEGVLKRITFPTGGFTDFDFENHKYFENGSIRNAGGLRVKSIISNDSKGNTITKTYRYGLNECDYGEKNFHVSFFHFSNQVTVRNHIDAQGFHYVHSRNRVFFSNPAVSLDGAEGSPVVYNYVSEVFGDAASNIGKIVYQYDSGIYVPDVIQGVPGSSKTFRNSKSWMRGKLSKKTVYDKRGDALSATEFYYKVFQENARHVGIGAAKKVLYPGIYLKPFFLQSCQNDIGEWVDGQEYGFNPFTQSTGAKLLIGAKERIYEPGNPARFTEVSEVNVRNSTFLEVTETRRSSSEPGRISVSRTKYPFSYSYNGTESGVAKAMRVLKEQNVLSTPIEQLSLMQNFDGSNVRVVGGTITEYVENPNNTRQIVPRGHFIFETATPVPIASFINSAVSGNNLARDSRFKERVSNKYDQYGNISQTTKLNDNDVSFLWGYNNQLPVAEIIGAQVKNVFYTSFEDLTTGTSSQSKTGVQSKTGGFTQFISGIDPGTYFLSYFTLNGSTWTHSLTEHVVTASSFTINLSGTVDEVRFHPKGSIMKTYSYRRPHGISTVSDENGLTSYYVYDDFGRLIAIRDDNGSLLKTYQYNYVTGN